MAEIVTEFEMIGITDEHDNCRLFRTIKDLIDWFDDPNDIPAFAYVYEKAPFPDVDIDEVMEMVDCNYGDGFSYDCDPPSAHVEGLDELKEAINKFNERNQDMDLLWIENRKKKVRVL